MDSIAVSAPRSTTSSETRNALETLIEDLARRDAKIPRGKRATARYDLNAPLKLGTRTDSSPIKPLCDAWGLNISASGVGMLTQQEFLPSRDVYLNLQTITGCPGWVKLRVIYSQKLVGTMVRSGAVFVLE